MGVVAGVIDNACACAPKTSKTPINKNLYDNNRMYDLI